MSSETNEIDETLPDVVKSFLRKGGQLEQIRLTERGEWKHEGLDFENPKIIQLFSRSVSQTPGGTWVLEIGRFTYPIVVDRTGYFVESFRAGPPATLDLSDGTSEALDPSTLVYEAGGKLFCRVKDNRFDARFKRHAYYSLVEHVSEQDDAYVLKLPGADPFEIQDAS